MPDVLGFKPNRELEFEHRRDLEFRPNRPLEFDPRRRLEFSPNRDLGFGRRGVVFRGFVCPICGALTTETATRCAECGATFGSPPAPVGPPRPQVQHPVPTPPAPPAALRPGKATAAPSIPGRAQPQSPAQPTAKRSKFCSHCGARLWEGDAFCWNCGARFAGSAATASLPQRQG